MSIECPRRIDYLAAQCNEFGLEVTAGNGKKIMKDDYVKVLRKYFINEMYGSEDNVPWSLRFMLSIECPQLCRRIQTLKEQDQEKLWSSNDWIAEEKIDGCRCLIVWDATEKKFHFFSRNNSSQNYLPQDYSDTIYVTAKNFDYKDSFVLDAEVISTNSSVETNIQCLTQLQSTAALLALNPEDSIAIQKKYPLKFIVFDCLFHGRYLIDEPWVERHNHTANLTGLLKHHGFNCELNRVVENTELNQNAKREFFEEIIDNNGEGVVLKNRNAKYHACSSRTIDCVKVKRSTSDTMTNDIDAFITDYVLGKDDTRNQNMVVGFVFSVKMEQEDGSIVTHPIATCSNVSDFIKEDATVYDSNGNATLNKDYYGRVATVQGQNISARNLRLTHSTIEMWRPEKGPEGCEVLKESDLKKLVF